MTIDMAINQVDDLFPNSYERKQKVEWLSRLESMIYRTVISLHEGDDEPFVPFTDDTPGDTELTMQEPYTEGYINWLQAQICFANQEIDKYNSAIVLFNTSLDGFKAEYVRGHVPKAAGPFLF